MFFDKRNESQENDYIQNEQNDYFEVFNIKPLQANSYHDLSIWDRNHFLYENKYEFTWKKSIDHLSTKAELDLNFRLLNREEDCYLLTQMDSQKLAWVMNT